MYGIIYLLTNKKTGKQYVGQTTRPADIRFRDHVGDRRNRHISNAIRKYGKEQFELEVIASCLTKEALNEAEIYFVNAYRTLHPQGYNHRAGGDQNGVCSAELRAKISKAKTGKPNLKRRGVPVSQMQKLQISRTLGGKAIKAVHQVTGEVKYYPTAHSTKVDGHNPSNVVSICKRNSYRTHSKNWVFSYIETSHANQSGSVEIKDTTHAQRLEIEPAKAE